MIYLYELRKVFIPLLLASGGDRIRYRRDPGRRPGYVWWLDGSTAFLGDRAVYVGRMEVEAVIRAAIEKVTDAEENRHLIKLRQSLEREGGMRSFLEWLRRQPPVTQAQPAI